MTSNASTTCLHNWNRPYLKLSLKRASGNKSKRGREWGVDIEKGKEGERKGMKKEKKKKGGREGKEEERKKDREKKNYLPNPFWRKTARMTKSA